MITQKHKPNGCPALIASIVCALLAATLLPAMTQASPLALPPRPTDQPMPPRPTAQPMPPRPTAQPMPPRPEPPQPAPEPSPHSAHRPPAGGFIELRFQTTQEGIQSIGRWQELWAVVQRQDGRGNWLVDAEEGWQGTFDEFSYNNDENVYEGKKTWWVAKADFDRGPYRWVVYQGRGGELLAQSEPFHLPHSAGDIVKVEMSLVPPAGHTTLPNEIGS